MKKTSALLIPMAGALVFAACRTSPPKRLNAIDLPPPFREAPADPKNGQTIVMQGNAKGATACLACHGANGEGRPGLAPRIANQSRLYLSPQLHNYRDGVRQNVVMEPIAKGLTDQEIEDVAAYYEQVQTPPYPNFPKPSAATLKRGREISEVGDAKLDLQSCRNCHGPDGIGQPPSIPAIGGQYADYLSAQLQAWRKGTRKSNPEHMGRIAKLLTDRDVEIVAKYFESARTPVIDSQAPKVEVSPHRNR